MPDRMAHARANAADAMPEIDAVVALRALYGPIVDGKGDGIALSKRHHLGAALHARALLGQHELAAGKIGPGFREQDRHLQREMRVRHRDPDAGS